MQNLSKEMLIKDVLGVDRGLALILMNHGMHCVGCPSAAAETLEQAAVSHGLDPDQLLEEMQAFLQNKGA